MPRKKHPVKILTLDTETIGFEGALKRIAIYDGVEVAYGYTFTDVYPVIEQYNKDFQVHVYIHNLDFDARKIPEIFERGNIKWSQTKRIGTKYAKIVCKDYILHDSFKILPMSLAKLSKDFALTYGKLDLWEEVQTAYPNQYENAVDFLNTCDPDDPIYLKYLGYDCISLYELLEKVMEVSGIPEDDFVKILSTASMSRYLFKNGYKGRIFKSPDREKTDFEILTSMKAWSSQKPAKGTPYEWLEIEYHMRQGFYGGRTEVFKPVAANAYHFDVNSLYPFAMLNEYPVGYPSVETEPLLAANVFDHWQYDRIGLGYIKARVFVPMQTIPPLPAKIGKLAFVCGHIEGTWTFTELQYAIDQCGVEVEEVLETIYFKDTYPVFYNFVMCFYELKEQGAREKNDSLKAFAKLILNTAYGWTVLRRDDKTGLRDIKDLKKWEDKEEFILANEELGYIEIWDKVITDTIQVQVGAYVTSYARLVLLEALRSQAAIGEVYYCDTDSIVCSEPLPPSMVDEYELGKWDLEKTIEKGLFLQPKVYYEKTAEEETVKFKGISKGRQKELDEDFYIELYGDLSSGERFNKIVEVGRASLPSLAVAQKRGDDPNKLKVIDKSIRIGVKQKRDIDFKNNTSTPHFMNSIDEFYNFNFEEFTNPPKAANLFGG